MKQERHCDQLLSSKGNRENALPQTLYFPLQCSQVVSAQHKGRRHRLKMMFAI